MDMCVRDAEFGQVGEQTLVYADDVTVIKESVGDLQDVANRWYQAAEGNRMKINTRVGKTEVVMISRRKEECTIYMGNVKLNKTANYSYLGVNIDEENRQECEVDKRIAKYNILALGHCTHYLRRSYSKKV